MADKRVVTFSRPVDRSLPAFRAWVSGIYHALGFSDDDDVTEEKCIEAWTAFWRGADSAQQAEEQGGDQPA